MAHQDSRGVACAQDERGRVEPVGRVSARFEPQEEVSAEQGLLTAIVSRRAGAPAALRAETTKSTLVSPPKPRAAEAVEKAREIEAEVGLLIAGGRRRGSCRSCHSVSLDFSTGQPDTTTRLT